jgi:hypothetical protein
MPLFDHFHGALAGVPLVLKGYGCVRLDLEATYMEACARLRIPE